jgi:putative endopeptidase
MYNELIIEDEHVNGELTLGENIADIGGVEISYNAMLRYKSIDSCTYKQEFYHNFANIWKNISRRKMTLNLLKTDPHSPPCFRVNTVVSNIDSFYEVFNVSKDNLMWRPPNERIHIW